MSSCSRRSLSSPSPLSPSLSHNKHTPHSRDTRAIDMCIACNDVACRFTLFHVADMCDCFLGGL